MSDFMNEWTSNEGVEQKEFSTIPEGEYVVQVDNCTIDMTKTPNRFAIVYKIVGPTQANRKLFGNYNLAGQGIGILKKDLKILGLDYSAIKKPEQLVELVWTAVNKKVSANVRHREFNGRTYESVYLNDVNGLAKKPSAKSAKPATSNKAKPQTGDEPDFSFV